MTDSNTAFDTINKARKLSRKQIEALSRPERMSIYEAIYDYHSQQLIIQTKDDLDGTVRVLDKICPALMTSYVASQKTILERQESILTRMDTESGRMTRLTKNIRCLTIIMIVVGSITFLAAVGQIIVGIVQLANQ